MDAVYGIPPMASPPKNHVLKGNSTKEARFWEKCIAESASDAEDVINLYQDLKRVIENRNLTNADSKEMMVVQDQLQNTAVSPISTSESKPDTEILIEESFDLLDRCISKISAVDSNPSSTLGHKISQQFAYESEEECMVLGDSLTKMSTSGFFSPQRVESECYGEIQSVNEQQETELTSSKKAETSKHHEKNVTAPIFFEEKELYVVVQENKHLQLKLDNHIILIGDYPSLSPPDSFLVNAMLNLAEQDLHELSPKPDYPDSLILFLQRNKRLTLIQPSFFDNMPELRFLDLLDTKIRILPSSLFKLSKLKVLLLRNCICLEKLQPEIELKEMEALDLSGTELYSLPTEISQLELMRRMHLSFYGHESEYGHLPHQLVSPRFLSKMKGMHFLTGTGVLKILFNPHTFDRGFQICLNSHTK